MSNYTNFELTNKNAISITPAAHVIQATKKLGLMAYITPDERTKREVVAALWKELLTGTEFTPDV